MQYTSHNASVTSDANASTVHLYSNLSCTDAKTAGFTISLSTCSSDRPEHCARSGVLNASALSTSTGVCFAGSHAGLHCADSSATAALTASCPCSELAFVTSLAGRPVVTPVTCWAWQQSSASVIAAVVAPTATAVSGGAGQTKQVSSAATGASASVLSIATVASASVLSLSLRQVTCAVRSLSSSSTKAVMSAQ